MTIQDEIDAQRDAALWSINDSVVPCGIVTTGGRVRIMQSGDPLDFVDVAPSIAREIAKQLIAAADRIQPQ